MRRTVETFRHERPDFASSLYLGGIHPRPSAKTATLISLTGIARELRLLTWPCVHFWLSPGGAPRTQCAKRGRSLHTHPQQPSLNSVIGHIPLQVHASPIRNWVPRYERLYLAITHGGKPLAQSLGILHPTFGRMASQEDKRTRNGAPDLAISPLRRVGGEPDRTHCTSVRIAQGAETCFDQPCLFW